MRELEPDKMTKSERLHWMYGADAMRKIEFEIHSQLVGWNAVPRDWHYIWENKDRRDANRTKLTARFDADVVKFFRSMGEGYQQRMNRVLRAYMHMRLAKLVEGPDTTDYVLNPERMMERGATPEWGDTKAIVERNLPKSELTQQLER